MIQRVLLVDDDAAVREALSQTLELADFAPIVAGSFIEAKDHLARDFDGIVVTDIRMPGRDGFHLLDYARKQDADLPVIVLTGEGDIPMAVDAVQAGAFAFLEKPCAPQDLISAVREAQDQRERVLTERRQAQAAARGDAAERMLFGQSALAAALRDRARFVASKNVDVLVRGAPGSGTSKVAEVIHLLSPIAQGPFVKRAATGLDPDTLDAILTDAEGGTVFLDEVVDLPQPAQFALLERLDEGGRARVIAGTYRDFANQTEAGRFNLDLALRLEMMPVQIPSLADRPEDIPVLFRHYVAQACEQAALPLPEITPDQNAQLMAQDWPGNARSLMNAAMRFALGATDTTPEEQLGLAEQLARVEKSLLIAALTRNGGRASQAATALKLPRKTFYDKLARHGLKAEDYRA
ncbi:sigma-54-dependent transcriptional regulator [Aestuariibius insulae]|uniref:sigma-54-dependent transcriptional regulator n=1 Tax=Aestuariibius insulae TaxID=2058287 RepID=UPI00345E13E8